MITKRSKGNSVNVNIVLVSYSFLICCYFAMFSSSVFVAILTFESFSPCSLPTDLQTRSDA